MIFIIGWNLWGSMENNRKNNVKYDIIAENFIRSSKLISFDILGELP